MEEYRINYNTLDEIWEICEDIRTEGDPDYNEVAVTFGGGYDLAYTIEYYEVYIKAPSIKSAFDQGLDLIDIAITKNKNIV